MAQNPWKLWAAAARVSLEPGGPEGGVPIFLLTLATTEDLGQSYQWGSDHQGREYPGPHCLGGDDCSDSKTA